MGFLVIVCVLLLAASWTVAYIQNKRRKQFEADEKEKMIQKIIQYSQDSKSEN